METSTIPHPQIASCDQWLTERKNLLANEKELTRHFDRVTAERRRLPMVSTPVTHDPDHQGLDRIFFSSIGAF